MLRILRLQRMVGKSAVTSLRSVDLSLRLSSHENTYRAWKQYKGQEVRIPRVKRTPASVRLRIESGVQHLEEQSVIFQNFLNQAQAQAIAAHIVSEGKKSKEIWDSVGYFFYLWQKTVDPTAIKPFSQGADQLESDFKQLKDFFEKGEGFRIEES